MSYSFIYFCLSFGYIISCYRSNLAAAIDVIPYFGIALNGDSGVTTYQSRVAMRFYTLTATEHTVFDFWCTDSTCSCSSVSESYRHRRIHFHTTYFTTAINVTIYRTIADDNSCITIRIIGLCAPSIFSHHGFITEEIVCFTLTTTIHITTDSYIFSNRDIIVTRFLGTDIHLRISGDISQFTATIDIACDVGTFSRCRKRIICILCIISSFSSKMFRLCIERNR